MRTTIRLKDDLAARAKRYAESNGMTFTQLVEQGLEYALNDGVRPKWPPLELPAYGSAASEHKLPEDWLKKVEEELEREEMEHFYQVSAQSQRAYEKMTPEERANIDKHPETRKVDRRDERQDRVVA